jgi:hypothetical protein
MIEAAAVARNCGKQIAAADGVVEFEKKLRGPKRIAVAGDRHPAGGSGGRLARGCHPDLIQAAPEAALPASST